MVVVVGKQPFVPDRRQIPDFLSQGFGIFDLSAMEWTSMYDAAAAPYVTPSAVRSWYDEHGRYPASWYNDTVAAWFGDPPAKQWFSKTGIIVGAAVGLVAVLLLIGAVTWFCLRRRSKKPEGRFALRRRSNKLEGPLNTYHDEAELDARGPIAPPYKSDGLELDSTGTVRYPYQTNLAEFDARPHSKEKDGWQVHEVQSSPKYELP